MPTILAFCSQSAATNPLRAFLTLKGILNQKYLLARTIHCASKKIGRFIYLDNSTLVHYHEPISQLFCGGGAA